MSFFKQNKPTMSAQAYLTLLEVRYAFELAIEAKIEPISADEFLELREKEQIIDYVLEVLKCDLHFIKEKDLKSGELNDSWECDREVYEFLDTIEHYYPDDTNGFQLAIMAIDATLGLNKKSNIPHNTDYDKSWHYIKQQQL
ncbi:hypothetical protein [Vibrio sp. PNB22_4_1]